MRCVTAQFLFARQAQQAVAMAKKDPSGFVMKAQREGGFLNYYDDGEAGGGWRELSTLISGDGHGRWLRSFLCGTVIAVLAVTPVIQPIGSNRCMNRSKTHDCHLVTALDVSKALTTMSGETLRGYILMKARAATDPHSLYASELHLIHPCKSTTHSHISVFSEFSRNLHPSCWCAVARSKAVLQSLRWASTQPSSAPAT